VSESRPVVTILLPLALVGYALVAVAAARWWISGLAAPVVAILL